MVDFLRSARSSFRAATLLSLAIVFVCLFVGVTNDYSAAVDELEELLAYEEGLYMRRSLNSLRAHSNDAETVALFRKLAAASSLEVSHQYPNAFAIWQRTRSNYSGSWFDTWPTYGRDLDSFLADLRGRTKQATFFQPELENTFSGVELLFESLKVNNPTLIAHRFGVSNGGVMQLEIDFDTQAPGVPDSIPLRGGGTATLIGSVKSNAGFRHKYAFDVDGRIVDDYPSFARFFVDSLGLFELGEGGRLVLPALEKLQPEIGNMNGKEALRYLRQVEETKKPKGSILSLPFNYLEKSWVPLILVLAFLAYGVLHLRAALGLTSRGGLASEFGWLLLLQGRSALSIRLFSFASPGVAALATIIIWNEQRVLNFLIFVAICVLSVIAYRTIGRLQQKLQTDLAAWNEVDGRSET